MLTERAERERKWGRFPALRKALEDKRVPGNYYGLTSVSDNMFDRMQRLLEISIAAHELANVVRETAQSTGVEEMRDDLDHLEHDIELARSVLERHADNIRALRSAL